MDITAYSQPIAQLLALLLICGIYRITTSTRNKKFGVPKVPEPPGSWPIIGHLHLLGRPVPVPQIFGAIAEKYGPIYSLRLGRRRSIVVSSHDIAMDCLITNDRVFATRPSVAVGKYMGFNGAALALAPYGSYWRYMRKIVTMELLSNSRLEMLKDVRASELDLFVKYMHSLCMKNSCRPTLVVMDELLKQLFFNIALRKIAGKRFSEDMYEDKSSQAWQMKDAVERALYLGGVFVVSDAFPWLEWLDIGGYLSSMKKVSDELDSLAGKWLEEHVQKRKLNSARNGEKDLMDLLLSIIPEDCTTFGHSRDTIIKATALVLIMTGQEGPTLTLTWALSLLLNNPRVLKAAQQELDLHVGRERWVQESDLPNLKYITAIIKETLRLYPPGPIAGPREALEDCYVGGYFIPKGTNLIINIWKLHRDPCIWPNPDEFRPERFITTHADVDTKSRNLEYMPFSSGRRSCPGVNYGMLVAQFAVAMVLQGFDMSTKGDMPVDMQEGLGIALPKSNPLEVMIKPRLSMELYTGL